MKKSFVFTAVGIFILFAGIAAGVYLVSKNQDVRERAAPATSLTVIGSRTNVSAGETFNETVNMNTGVNQIVGIDLVLKYDPLAFDVVSVIKGNGISGLTQEIKNTIDTVGGRVYYSIFTVDKTKAVTGANVQVVVITFKARSNATPGSFSFSMINPTAVAGIDEGQNVLISTTPATIIVATSPGGASSPTPLPTPAPTATPKLTASPTATSTSVSGASVTASPKSVFTVTPTSMPLPVTGGSGTTLIGFGLGTLFLIICFGLLLI